MPGGQWDNSTITCVSVTMRPQSSKYNVTKDILFHMLNQLSNCTFGKIKRGALPVC